MADDVEAVAPPKDRPRPPPRRIHIIGPEASGKTTLALRLAPIIEAPVYHLDYVSRVGIGGGAVLLVDPRYQPPVRLPRRPFHERIALVDSIADMPAWVTEGKHLAWTAQLMAQADVIIWLDHISFWSSSRRIIARFARSAIREARVRSGIYRFARFLDYARHGGELLGQLFRLHRYYFVSEPPQGSIDQAILRGRPEPITRRGTLRELEPYRGKVIHIRRPEDLERFVETLAGPNRP